MGLDLSDNNLLDALPDMFEPLRALSDLGVSGNKLQFLSARTLAHLVRCNGIGNPWIEQGFIWTPSSASHTLFSRSLRVYCAHGIALPSYLPRVYDCQGCGQVQVEASVTLVHPPLVLTSTLAVLVRYCSQTCLTSVLKLLLALHRIREYLRGLVFGLVSRLHVDVRAMLSIIV